MRLSTRRTLSALMLAVMALTTSGCHVWNPGPTETLNGVSTTPANPLGLISLNGAVNAQLYGPFNGQAAGVIVHFTTEPGDRVLPMVMTYLTGSWDVLVVPWRAGAAGHVDANDAVIWARARAGNRPVVAAGELFGGAVAGRQALTGPVGVDAAILLRPVVDPSVLTGTAAARWAATVAGDQGTATSLNLVDKAHPWAVPVYVAHGDADTTAPYAATREMYDRWVTSGNLRAWFDTIEGHDGPVDTTLNIAALSMFLDWVQNKAFHPANASAPKWGERRVFTVGDSLTSGSVSPGGLNVKMAAAGYQHRHNARVGRPTAEGIRVLAQEAQAGRLEPVVVVALGTNDVPGGNTTRFAGQVDEVMRIVGPDRHVIWVNLQLNRWPTQTAAFNTVLATKDATYPNMTVADWNASGPRHQLARDGVHYNGAGYRTRADQYVGWVQEVTGNR